MFVKKMLTMKIVLRYSVQHAEDPGTASKHPTTSLKV